MSEQFRPDAARGQQILWRALANDLQPSRRVHSDHPRPNIRRHPLHGVDIRLMGERADEQHRRLARLRAGELRHRMDVGHLEDRHTRDVPAELGGFVRGQREHQVGPPVGRQFAPAHVLGPLQVLRLARDLRHGRPTQVGEVDRIDDQGRLRLERAYHVPQLLGAAVELEHDRVVTVLAKDFRQGRCPNRDPHATHLIGVAVHLGIAVAPELSVRRGEEEVACRSALDEQRHQREQPQATGGPVEGGQLPADDQYPHRHCPTPTAAATRPSSKARRAAEREIERPDAPCGRPTPDNEGKILAPSSKDAKVAPYSAPEQQSPRRNQ